MTLEEQIVLNLGLEPGATTIPISVESKLMADAFLETVSDSEEEARSLATRLDEFIEERNNEFFSDNITLIDRFAIGLSVAASIATLVGDLSPFKFPILAARFNFLALTGDMLQIKEGIDDGNLLITDFTGLLTDVYSGASIGVSVAAYAGVIGTAAVGGVTAGTIGIIGLVVFATGYALRWAGVDEQLTDFFTYLDNFSRPRLDNGRIIDFGDDILHSTVSKRISDSISVESIEKILEASSKVEYRGYESLLKAYEKLITGTENNAPILDSNEYFQRVLSLLQAIGSNPTGELKFSGDPTIDLLTQAKLDNTLGLATRYALQELNPFILDTTATDPNFYDQHNVPNSDGIGLLDIENFSDDYLNDRAAFLVSKIKVSLVDTDFDQFTENGNDITNVRYEDRTSGFVIETSVDQDRTRFKNNYTFGTNETDFISGVEQDTFINVGNNHFYGQLGDDILVGGRGKDLLEGGGGNDTLYSSDFNRTEDNAKDTLRGGKGEDAYYVGDGDEIEDSDRKVQFIEFNAVAIGGQYVEVLPDQYENLANNNLTLEITGNDAVINLAQGSLTKTFTIKNFKDAGQEFNDGDYGITLLEQAPPAPIEFNGTVDKDIIDVDASGTQIDLLDNNGNLIGGETLIDPVQVIRGMEDDDFIQVDANIANLVIYGDSEGDAPGLDGDDWIEIDRINVANDTTPSRGQALHMTFN